MNKLRNTKSLRNVRIILWLFLITSAACSTPQKQTEDDDLAQNNNNANENHEENLQVEAVVKANPAYAEPVDPSTVVRFPHLSSYVGHILIGNSFVQAVLAGVPSEPDMGTLWEPAVLGLFEFRNDAWRPLVSVTSLKLMPFAPEKRKLVAYAVDTSVDKKTGKAHAKFYYTVPGVRFGQNIASYFLTNNGRILTLGFGESQGKQLPAIPGAQKWALQINSTNGAIIPESTKKTSRSFTYFYQDDALGVVGYESLLPIVKPQFTTLQPVADAKPLGWGGYEFLIGKEANNEFIFRTSMLDHCAKNPEVRKVLFATKDLASKMDFVDQCVKLQPKSYISLSAPKEKSKFNQLPRRLLLLDEKEQTLGYSFLLPNSTIEIPLAAESKIILKDLSSGELLNKDSPIVAAESAIPTELKVRPTGELQISAEGAGAQNSAAPTFMRVKYAYLEGGTNASAEIKSRSDLANFSDNTFEIKEWPIRFQAFAGNYVIDIFRGIDGRICSLKVKIEDDGVSKEKCILEAPSAIAQTTSNELPSRFEVEDPENHIKLALYPFSEQLADQWQEFAEQKEQKDLPQMELLASFAKTKAPEAILELGCPSEKISNSEYINLVSRLKPNALQTYGCNQKNPERFVSIYRQVFARGHLPTLITSVSGAEPGWNRNHLPQMVISQTGEDKNASIRRGLYTLSSGSQIELIKSQTKNEMLEVELKINKAGDTSPRLLKVYSENGVVYQISLNFGDKNEKHLRQSIPFALKHRFVRFEVTGYADDNEEANATNNVEKFKVLAATNFVNARPPAAGSQNEQN